MTVKNLYLHIGRGKTGTTAIQSFLSANRTALGEQGLHYVLADDAERGVGHQNFAKSFVEKPPPYMAMPANPEQIREAVADELVQVRNPSALLSSENFSLANVEEVAVFFARRLSTAAIKVIFFARSQDELAESQYNQLIKLGLCDKTFYDYIETELDEMDYPSLLAPWATHFGKENVIARVYDASRATVIDDFLACLDLSGSSSCFKTVPQSAANESVGYLALRIFRLLNELDLPQRRKVYPLLAAAIKSGDLPALFFDSTQASAFRERFRASNQAFIREYLGGAGDDVGGRKYSAAERDRIYALIRKLDRASHV